MEEQASFETRAVLAPRRARLTRLALLLPVVALVATAWAGVSGPRSEPLTAAVPDPPVVAAPSLTAEESTPAPPIVIRPRYPAQALGLDVTRLGDVQLARLTRDDLIAVAGWYLPTAITDCPPLAAVYREPALPGSRPKVDSWAFCERTGVLYASRPTLVDGRPPALGRDVDQPGDGPLAVAATLVIGVRMPAELQAVGAGPTPIVILGRFVESSDACMLLGACPYELVIDHVAWTPEA